MRLVRVLHECELAGTADLLAAACRVSSTELTARRARFIVKMDSLFPFEARHQREPKTRTPVISLTRTISLRHRRFGLTSLIWRLGWLLMLVVHVGAILESWRALLGGPAGAGTGALLRALALSGLAAFFVLKFIDVRWLRLAGGWRSKVAATIVVALLHVGVVERATGIEADLSPAHVGVVLFVAGAVDSRRLLRLTSALRRLFIRVFFRIVPQWAAEQFAQLADHEQRSILARAHLNALPLRAPPCA